MTLAEMALRAKADYDQAYEAGYSKGCSEAGSTSTGGLTGTTWVLDEHPDPYTKGGMDTVNLEITFTCANGMTYYAIWSDGRYILYTGSGGDNQEVVYGEDGWVDDIYRTITIVKTDDWLSENAELQK